MPKEMLTGSLDEQCEFLYRLAHEKMEQGNYTGAVHALEEIVAHAPAFRDAQGLLAEAKRRKAVQRTLLFYALGGAAVSVSIGTLLRAANDLVFLGLAIAGALAGWFVGNLLLTR